MRFDLLRQRSLRRETYLVRTPEGDREARTNDHTLRRGVGLLPALLVIPFIPFAAASLTSLVELQQFRALTAACLWTTVAIVGAALLRPTLRIRFGDWSIRRHRRPGEIRLDALDRDDRRLATVVRKPGDARSEWIVLDPQGSEIDRVRERAPGVRFSGSTIDIEVLPRLGNALRTTADDLDPRIAITIAIAVQRARN